MALTKTAAPTREINTLLAPEGYEDVAMNIPPEAMARMVERLIDLYQDPVASTVRELCSNALDATLRMPAGDRQPIQVTSPTHLNPNFVVTDLGVGMSTDIVRTVFSQFGGSLKTGDVTQTGDYGLGAKAPLAYTAEFFVETTQEGITTNLIVMRHALGNVTRIISVEPTGRPSGTRVTVPASVADVDEFQKAVQIYRNYSFDTPFIVDGQAPAPERDYFLFDSIVIEEESGTTGRVWVEKNYIKELFKLFLSPHASVRYSYLLSGWLYGEPHSRTGSAMPQILVELKPGVVDFSSSRDSITSNDRSRLLKNLVDKQLLTRSYVLSNFLRYFRTLSLADALVLLHNLSDRFHADPVENCLVYKSNGVISVAFKEPFSSFVLSSGDDPFSVLAEVTPPDVYSATLYARDAAHTPFKRSTTLDLLGSHADTVGGARYRPMRVAEANEHVTTAAATGEVTLSVADFLKTNGQALNYAGAYIVAEADVTVIKKLLNARSLFLKLHAAPLIFFTAGEPFTAEKLAKLQELTPKPVQQLTATEYLAEIKKLRSEELSKNGKQPLSVDETIRFQVLRSGDEPLQDVLNNLYAAITRNQSTFAELTLAEVQAEDGVLLLARNHAGTVGEALKGASNAGVRLEKRPIYLMPSDELALLRDAHLRKLQSYDGVIVNQWSYSTSIAGRTLVAQRTYSASMLREEAAALPQQDVIRGILNKGYWNNGVERLLSLLVKAEDKTVAKPAKIGLEALKTSTSGRTIPEEFMPEVLDTDLFRALKTFSALYDRVAENKGSSYGSFLLRGVTVGDISLKKEDRYYPLLLEDALTAFHKTSKKLFEPEDVEEGASEGAEAPLAEAA